VKFVRLNWYESGLVPLVNVSTGTPGAGKNRPELSGAFVIRVRVNPPAGMSPVNETRPPPSQLAVIFVTANASPCVSALAALSIVAANDHPSAIAIIAARKATVCIRNRSRISVPSSLIACGRTAPRRPIKSSAKQTRRQADPPAHAQHR